MLTLILPLAAFHVDLVEISTPKQEIKSNVVIMEQKQTKYIDLKEIKKED
jgi:hypothetical protein